MCDKPFPNRLWMSFAVIKVKQKWTQYALKRETDRSASDMSLQLETETLVLLILISFGMIPIKLRSEIWYRILYFKLVEMRIPC